MISMERAAETAGMDRGKRCWGRETERDFAQRDRHTHIGPRIKRTARIHRLTSRHRSGYRRRHAPVLLVALHRLRLRERRR